MRYATWANGATAIIFWIYDRETKTQITKLAETKSVIQDSAEDNAEKHGHVIFDVFLGMISDALAGVECFQPLLLILRSIRIALDVNFLWHYILAALLGLTWLHVLMVLAAATAADSWLQAISELSFSRLGIIRISDTRLIDLAGWQIVTWQDEA